MGKPSQPGVERLISNSSELSKRSYDLSKVKVIVETVLLPGIVRGVTDVSVVLGPKLVPVQNGVRLPDMLALCKIRLLSLPT